MGTLSITNVTSGPVNIQDLYITIQAGDTEQVERTWNELTAMKYLHEAIADGKVTIDFDPSEDELASGLVPTTGTAESETRNIAYYVSPNGLDTNTGLSPTSPLKTFHAAFQKLPSQWGEQCRIFFAPGTYPVDADGESFFLYTLGMHLGPGSEALGLVGSYTDPLGGDRTSTAGTTGVIVEDDTLSMTTDEHVGKQILVLTGADAGKMYMIASNTATQLSMIYPTGMSPGDTFRLQEQAVIFDITSNIVMVGASRAASELVMYGIKCNLTGSGALRFIDMGVTMAGVEVDMTPGEITNRLSAVYDADIWCGTAMTRLPGVLPSGFIGMHLKGGHETFALTMSEGSSVGGYVVQSGGGGQYIGNAKASYYNMFVSGGGTVYVGGNASSFRHVGIGGVTGKITGATGVGLVAEQHARVERASSLEISGCGSHAVHVMNMSNADVRQISGTGNGGHGLAVERMSQVTVEGMTVTGTGGDVLVDATTTDHTTAEGGVTGTGSRVESRV